MKCKQGKATQYYNTSSSMVRQFNPFKPSGHYMYHQFNIQQFYVLRFVLCASENKQRLFPYTALTDWFL
jgi:hypothetical protein